MGPKQPPSSERPVQNLVPAPGDAPASIPASLQAAAGPGDTVTVEAATAEKALEELTGLVGPDAEILRADKVQRGGIGGFFAREVVQLTARRRPGGPAAPAAGTGSDSGSVPAVAANPAPQAGSAPAGAPAQAPVEAPAPAPVASLASPAAPQAGSAAAVTPATPAAPAGPAGSATAGNPGGPAANGGTADPFAAALSRFLSEEDGTEEPAPQAAVRPSASAAAAAAPSQPPAGSAPASAEMLQPARPATATSPAADSTGNVRPFTPPAVVLDAPATPNPAPPTAQPPAPPPSTGSPPLQARPTPAVAAVAPVIARSSGRPEPRTGSSSDAAPGTGEPNWSPEELLRLGLPVSLVRPMIDNPPTTDAAWIEAVSAAVGHLCGPLAALDREAQLLVGPRAHLLAGPLGLPQADYPDTPPTGSAVMSLHVPTADLGLVLRLLGDRRLHLVAGGEGWEGLSTLRPSVVSWVGAEALPGALALCAGQGLTLGYGRPAGTPGTGGGTFRSTPLDVALALRSLLGRR